MDRQHESEVVAAGVRLDDRLGRAVPFNRTEDGRITGVARLCEFEFLEEFPDAPVSVLLGEEAKLFQVSFLDRPVGPRNAVDLHSLRRERHDDRLGLAVRFVVYGVGKRLFDGGIRIVPMAFGLGASRHLEHLFHEHVVLDVRQAAGCAGVL